MINQTLENIRFEEVIKITQNPIMILVLGIIWFSPLFIYLIVGAFKKGKSSTGRETSKSMWSYPNYWISIFIWGFIQLGLFIIGLIFPIWLKLLES